MIHPNTKLFILEQLSYQNSIQENVQFFVTELQKLGKFSFEVLYFIHQDSAKIFHLKFPDKMRKSESINIGTERSLKEHPTLNNCFENNNIINIKEATLRKNDGYELKLGLVAGFFKNLVYFPISCPEQNPIGILGLTDERSDIPDDIISEVQELLKLFCPFFQKSLFIDNIKKHQIENAEFHKKQKKIFQAAARFNMLLQPQELYDFLICELVDIFGFDIGSIQIEKEKKLPTVACSTNKDEYQQLTQKLFDLFSKQENAPWIYPPLGPGSASAIAFLNHTHFYAYNVQEIKDQPMSRLDKKALAELDKMGRQLKSLVLIPILSGKQSIGVVQLHSYEKLVMLDDSDIQNIISLCRFIPSILQNSYLHSQLEQQKVRLENTNKEKNEFLGIAAHDLRNPIGVINNFAKLLLKSEELFSHDEKADIIETIADASGFMLNLIEDLLDISKIESGNLDLKCEPHNYIQFAEKVIRLNRILASDKKIQIHFSAPSKLPEISFDENKVRQVLDNLIGNAIKYSQPGTEIWVTIKKKRKSNMMITQVKDQGPGIPQTELNEIFRAFFKGSSQATRGEKSTGLGLTLAKKMIEGHHGEIWVESTQGEGSTFSYSLPLPK